jgi:hypothetical protein
MKKKALILCLIALVLILGLIFRNRFIRLYVRLFDDRLEAYAVQMLEENERSSGRYGLWKTVCIPAAGMVEFRTGGWGLTPAATYQGFYYAADNAHRAFGAADVPIEIAGDTASWTDGTDNRGTSVRITENWFWYTASF